MLDRAVTRGGGLFRDGGLLQMTAIPMNGETWLICGGRTFVDEVMFCESMRDIISLKGCPSRIVNGDAPGADRMSSAWARSLGIEVVRVPANWTLDGRRAGPIRNQRMLDIYNPSCVIAFPGGDGTADMVRRSRVALKEVIEVKSK